MTNTPVPEWTAPATAVALPAALAGFKYLRGGVPNPFVLAAAAAAGYALPKAWNEVVARHKDDAEFEKEIRARKDEIFTKAIGKYAGFISGVGGLMIRGGKAIGGAVKDVGKAVVMTPKAGAPVSERLLRPLALGGVVAAGYGGTKAVVNASKPYDYGTYERNLVRYGHISPSEMSRSGFERMVKQSSAISTGMNVLMGGFALQEGVTAAKKVKTPIMGSAIQQSAVYGNAGGTMNNFR